MITKIPAKDAVFLTIPKRAKFLIFPWKKHCLSLITNPPTRNLWVSDTWLRDCCFQYQYSNIYVHDFLQRAAWNSASGMSSCAQFWTCESWSFRNGILVGGWRCVVSARSFIWWIRWHIWISEQVRKHTSCYYCLGLTLC